ncbi:hypothetical protein GCM10009682_30320 [Luedemannella flava]|uniref:Uncharacterized protein n=1 Tax=Luedemannella flava TaxID=349316 RepID=A0ABP4Y7N3_9ACTN
MSAKTPPGARHRDTTLKRVSRFVTRSITGSPPISAATDSINGVVGLAYRIPR